jgi:tRNA pseudouridine55 synthase
VDGFINLKKLPTWTSHDCVAKVRRILQTKKVGHGGTLDPAAVGVLPIKQLDY